LGNGNFVSPRNRSFGGFLEFDVNLDVGMLARRKAADFRQTTSVQYGALEAASGLRYVTKESQRVKEVRLA